MDGNSEGSGPLSDEPVFEVVGTVVDSDDETVTYRLEGQSSD